MPAIEDHDYIKICAELASSMSISIASAKRKVEIAATKGDVRDLEGRKLIAEKLLNKAKSINHKREKGSKNQLDKLLKALAHEENFMTED